MKKLILISFVLLLVTVSYTSARDFAIGVKGGLNLARVVEKEIEQDTDFRTAGIAGIFVTIKMGGEMLAIQPEVLFSMKGAETDSDLLSNNILDVSMQLDYVEIPILAKISFPISETLTPNIFIGPVIALNTKAKAKYEILGVEREDDLENITDLDMGLVLGGGIKINKLLVEVRYTMGLKSIYELDTAEDIFDFDSEADVRNQVISIMAGFSF
ncbi:outer membrane beta-barrel protein [Candidatus Poribacteria bacterium]|nr:outer membrane beta-barrel protein [Candidatus Poribacteria bacterium]